MKSDSRLLLSPFRPPHVLSLSSFAPLGTPWHPSRSEMPATMAGTRRLPGPGPKGPRGYTGSISERAPSTAASEGWCSPSEEGVGPSRWLPSDGGTTVGGVGGVDGREVQWRLEVLEDRVAALTKRLENHVEAGERETRVAKEREGARQWNAVLVAKYGRRADLLPMGTIDPYIQRAADVDGFNTAELLARIEDLGGCAPAGAEDDLLRIYLLSLLGVAALPPVKLDWE